MKESYSHYLTNQFLIAMPQLEGSEFARSLIYLVSHNEDGAMGLIVNQHKSLHLVDVLEQLKPETLFPADKLMTPIYHGGPVEQERGFVLHPKDKKFEGTIELPEINITSSQDILFSIAENKGPQQSLIVLGYAGWGAGQLEKELLDNSWLTCPFRSDIVFDIPAEQRLDVALGQLGIHFSSLSLQVGHA